MSISIKESDRASGDEDAIAVSRLESLSYIVAADIRDIRQANPVPLDLR
ncbi:MULTISPECIES: hypothetical protein [Cyanophyceae]|nr:hypothetical protein [Trichocoleus sp. FACHB-40]MBD2004980.1 hypothetical protein [Trichocoleus sp. FACHB-40]